MNKIEIYTLPVCPYCIKAKKLLSANGLEYNEHDISSAEDEMREDLKKRFNLPAPATVPQIIINEKYVGGYSELENLYKTGRIKEFLN